MENKTTSNETDLDILCDIDQEARLIKLEAWDEVKAIKWAMVVRYYQGGN
jgi:hypothetical protein